MLTVLDAPTNRRFCDGLSRRGFLQAGALWGASLTLADLFRSRAEGGTRRSSPSKSVINIVLPGGPSHLDSYDPKPLAPAEIRGEFRAIPTTVPGLWISELMPRQARIADKLAVIRNMSLEDGDAHQLHVPLTGFRSTEKRPAFGSLVSRVQSQGSEGNRLLPHYVSLVGDHHPEIAGHEEPQYAGVAHRPFVPDGPGMGNLRLRREISLDRLNDRALLLGALDNIRRDIDASGELAGLDSFTVQALEMISSPKVREAFDLSLEPERVHALYGPDVRLQKQAMYTHVWRGTKFLLARRLVEAGVSVVSLSVGFWDTHADNFVYLREQLPLLDRCLSALITDLDERGMLQDVALVVWGEFYGRTPRINKDAGRDHWKNAGAAVVAGGGLRTGQVIGATDGRGERFVGTPLYPQNVLATLYHVLGIDPATTIQDHNGRPRHLLDDREPIGDLL